MKNKKNIILAIANFLVNKFLIGQNPGIFFRKKNFLKLIIILLIIILKIIIKKKIFLNPTQLLMKKK